MDDISTKYQRLIDGADRKGKSLYNNSSGDEKCFKEKNAEVLHFLLDNTDIELILDEAFGSNVSNEPIEMTVDSCLSYFQTLSSSLQTKENLISSHMLAKRLIKVVQRENHNNLVDNKRLLLQEEVKNEVLLLIDLVKRIIALKKFDKIAFIKKLPLTEISVEILWLFDKRLLISFQTYFLSWYNSEDFVYSFCNGVKNLCKDDCSETFKLRYEILQGIFGTLFQIIYNETEKDKQKIKDVSVIFYKVLDFVDTEVVSNENKWSICLYQVIREATYLPCNAIRQFFEEAFDCLVQRPNRIPVEQFFGCQENHTFESLKTGVVQKYEQFVFLLGADGIIKMFERALETFKEINIQILMHFLVVSLIYIEDFYKRFEILLDHQMTEALTNRDISKMKMSFLLRRQAALEGSHICPSYDTWFEQKCSIDGILICRKIKRIQFLYKFLTDIVPYEKPGYLKVHIFKSRAPGKFKSIVDDYISLAKTRLADMNVTLDTNSGIFTKNIDVNSEKSKLIEQAKADVEKALKLYENTGEVPSSIMEASIFSKPYFIRRFLPALLTPRTLPNIPDVKSRLINDLNSAGKIPQNMMRSYERKCEEFEDTINIDQPGYNVESIKGSFEKLSLLIQNFSNDKSDEKDLTSWLSQTSRRLKIVFPHNGDAFETMNISSISTIFNQEQIETAYTILNSFCKIFRSIPRRRNISKLMMKLVLLLFSFPLLISCLYVHIWTTVSQEYNSLDDEHIYGLAIFVLHLSSTKQGQTSKITLGNSEKETYYECIAELIVAEISLKCIDLINFYISWCCGYLQSAVVSFNVITTKSSNLTSSNTDVGYIPEYMIIKMQYLLEKLRFAKKDTMFESDHIRDVSKVIETCLNKIKVTEKVCDIQFSDWLLWELRMQESILLENERQGYYNWAVYEKFMKIGNGSGCREIASTFVSVFLNHYTCFDEVTKKRYNHSNEISLLKILNDIVYSIHSNGTSDDEQVTHNWLLDLFVLQKTEAMDCSASEEIDISCQTMAFLRLVTALPPWLLLGDHDVALVTEKSVNKLSCFINTYIKPNLFSGTFVMPYNLIIHIFKAFVSRNSEHISRMSMFRRFLEETPLVFGSIIFYWNQLVPSYYHHFENDDVLKGLKLYHIWLTEKFVPLPNFNGYSCGFAYAIFLHLKRGIDSPLNSSTNKDISKILTKLKDSSPESSDQDKIVLVLMDIILNYIIDNTFCQNKVKDASWLKLCQEIIRNYNDVLQVFTQDTQGNPVLETLRSQVTPNTRLLKLLPVVFFRILLSFDTLPQPLTTHCHTFTNKLLLMYLDFNELFKESQPNSGHLNSLEFINTDFFVEVTQFLKQSLRGSPTKNLKVLPQDLIERLPQEIRCYLV